MTPRCSIVIPVHNKAALTRQCLDSILESPPAATLEILVVDDASSDSTPELLASYGDSVRPVRLERNAGFATACNTGAAESDADLILFLNNDTIVLDGWLDTLVEYADSHPEAAVVGSKLLYPDETVQHAGVVFGLSGDPLHIYAGSPPDHPAVCKSRRFQAVTAACMLIRRDSFEAVGGFDTDYHNDLEDVDLCLRLGRRGQEVHLCHESVLYHLESVSRGKHNRPRASAKVYRRRWGGKVRSDELDYYLEDGLLHQLRGTPATGVPAPRGSAEDAHLLQARSLQLQEMLREAVRLDIYTGVEREVATPAPVSPAGGMVGATTRRSPGRIKRRLKEDLRRLRGDLAASWPANGGSTPAPRKDGDARRAALKSYERVVARLPRRVRDVTPVGSLVLVVSKGDDRLLEIHGRRAWHFPRAEDGRYAGYHPRDGEAAIKHLEELRARGAAFLVFPKTALWWLNYYPALTEHLESRYAVAARDDNCLVLDVRLVREDGKTNQERLIEPGSEEVDDGATGASAPVEPSEAETASAEPQSDDTHQDDTRQEDRSVYEGIVGRVHERIAEIVPEDATVLVVSRGDGALVDMPDRRGWHFPQDESGRYLGYHPANDDDAISRLEELRARGAEYLVIPESSSWWLDYYGGFAEHLEIRYPTLARDESCVIFGLSAQLAPEVVRQLLPAGASIVVASPFAADVHGFKNDFDAQPLLLGDDPDELPLKLVELANGGAQYVVFPEAAFGWLERHPDAVESVRTSHVLVTLQQHACEVLELRSGESEDVRRGRFRPAEEEPLAGAVQVDGSTPTRSRGPLARLLRGREERDREDG